MARKKGVLQRWFRKIVSNIGWGDGASRRVRFQPQTAVFEFERQLGGGGGVPDGDTVALGLGPRCVHTYLSPLNEKQTKDEYAASGYLDAGQRTQLLSQWAAKASVKAALDRARPEIEKLQKAREETASSPRDQRYMPTNVRSHPSPADRSDLASCDLDRPRSAPPAVDPLTAPHIYICFLRPQMGEALMLASQDEEEAQLVRQRGGSLSSIARTTRWTNRTRRTANVSTAATAAQLATPITKTTRRGRRTA